MPTPDDACPQWRKATASEQQGECVEAADFGAAIGVRDSKNPSGPKLRVSRQQWTHLVAEIKADQHNL